MLTDTKARQAKPKDKDYKLADAGGLYLFVTTKGFKSWRMKYRFGDKEKRLTFGAYPEVSLSEARERRDAARRQLREHRDPKVETLRLRAAALADHAATFETIARRWHSAQAPRWAPVHADDVIRSLERDAFPSLGSLPIKDIEVRHTSGSPRSALRARTGMSLSTSACIPKARAWPSAAIACTSSSPRSTALRSRSRERSGETCRRRCA